MYGHLDCRYFSEHFLWKLAYVIDHKLGSCKLFFILIFSLQVKM
jgi:hypothetical protein